MQNRKQLMVGFGLALITSTAPAHAQSVFSDVPDNHWAAAAVKALAEAGIIEGRPASTQSEPVVHNTISSLDKRQRVASVPAQSAISKTTKKAAPKSRVTGTTTTATTKISR